MKKKIIGSILAVFPSLLTLVLAIVSWDSLLRMVASGMGGATGEEASLSQYGSLGIWSIIVPLVLAALGTTMMVLKENKGKTIKKIFGGLLIVASCITVLFNWFMVLDITKNLTFSCILAVLELIAAITGIVLLSLKDKK